MRKIILLSFIFSFCTYIIQAATITVCASGCDETTIAAAITSATAGDLIDIQYTGSAYTEAAITVDKNLTIQGQGQTSTIIQAAATQAAADDQVFIINTTGVVRIENLTIQNGNALTAGTSNLDEGGAAYITNGNTRFTNVTFTNNRANNTGGALNLLGNGGILILTDCVFSNNEAPNNGGAIWNSSADNFTINRCTFLGNITASNGGAIYNVENGSTVKIINSTITSNTAESNGAGLYLANAASYDIINCTIVNNTLTTGVTRHGGGIYHANATLNLTNTIVANNSGATAVGLGDDIYANSSNAITQTTSLVADCDNGSGTCATFSYTNAAGIATSPTICGQQSFFKIGGSDAEDNGTTPSGDIPTDDICGNVRSAPHHIGSIGNALALPVELISFEVERTTRGTLLAWQTAMEENNEGFHIQRSADGQKWENIDFMVGAGTTQEEQRYIYTDKEPLQGINYYRLKQVDFDGIFDYSSIVSVNYDLGLTTNTVTIFPNPTSNQITVQGITSTIRLHNALGQTLKIIQMENESVSIDLTNLPKGQYFLEIVGDNGQQTVKKFIKK